MRTRSLKPSDIPVLRSMAEGSGYPYPEADAKDLVAVVVVVNEDDTPIMAAAVEPILQAYLWCEAGPTPHERVAALRLIHEALASCLKQRGYNQLEAFIPPTLAQRFGRRLEKTFGWTKNWPSWNRTF